MLSDGAGGFESDLLHVKQSAHQVEKCLNQIKQDVTQIFAGKLKDIYEKLVFRVLSEITRRIAD